MDRYPRAYPGCDILLYGSTGMGFEHPNSDIDLLVISPNVSDTNQGFRSEVVLGRPAQILVVSEKAFLRDRQPLHYLASVWDEATQLGVRLIGERTFLPLMTAKERLETDWMRSLVSLCLLTQMPSRAETIKVLTTASLVLLGLEDKICLGGYVSIGNLVNRVLSDEVVVPDDPLWNFIDRSGVLWRWLDDDLAHHGRGMLVEWCRELSGRFFNFLPDIAAAISFKPVTTSGHYFFLGHPFYNGIRWSKNEDGDLVMEDGGAIFLGNVYSVYVQANKSVRNYGRHKRIKK